VEQIEWQGKRATGVIGAFLAPGTQEATGRAVRVEARVVVVAGGAINSPVILLRSGLEQGPVGRKTWLHPVVAMGAFYDQRIEGFYGAPQSVASHHLYHLHEGAGLFNAAVALHPLLLFIAMPLVLWM